VLFRHCKVAVHPHGGLAIIAALLNGTRLHGGRSRVTLRALDKKGNVLGLSRPVTVRIR